MAVLQAGQQVLWELSKHPASSQHAFWNAKPARRQERLQASKHAGSPAGTLAGE
jgi:hypothetical protein